MGYEEILLNGIFLLPNMFAPVATQLREKFTLNFISSTCSLSSFWLTCSLSQVYLRCTQRCEAHSLPSRWGWWHTHTTLKEHLPCYQDKTRGKTLKLSEDKSKAHGSIHIPMKGGHNQLDPVYCNPGVQHLSPFPAIWFDLACESVLLPGCQNDLLRLTSFPGYRYFQLLSPGCHSVLHATEWQSQSPLCWPDLPNSHYSAATQTGVFSFWTLLGCYHSCLTVNQ